MVHLLKSVNFRWNAVRFAVFARKLLQCNRIFRGLMEHDHSIGIMAMLDYIMATPCKWKSPFMPWTLVNLMISKHLQGSRMTQGSVLGSKLTPGTLLCDYFRNPYQKGKTNFSSPPRHYFPCCEKLQPPSQMITWPATGLPLSTSAQVLEALEWILMGC